MECAEPQATVHAQIAVASGLDDWELAHCRDLAQ